MLNNGKSMLIATHIHLAPGGTNGANGEGPPMINFCGSNKAGMINDGTPYPEERVGNLSVVSSWWRSMEGVAQEERSRSRTRVARKMELKARIWTHASAPRAPMLPQEAGS